MNFTSKLIEDTKSGNLDFVWKYSEPGKYTFFWPKHPMNGMSFDSTSKRSEIIFPNGVSLKVEKESLTLLETEITSALLRAVDEITKNYIK